LPSNKSRCLTQIPLYCLASWLGINLTGTRKMGFKIVIGVLALAISVATFSPLQYERQRGIHSAERSSASKTPENFLQKAFTKARLPKTVHPVSYDLTLTPILDEGVGSHEQWTAPGSVAIVVNTDVATNRITLNSVGLTYSTATLKV